MVVALIKAKIPLPVSKSVAQTAAEIREPSGMSKDPAITRAVPLRETINIFLLRSDRSFVSYSERRGGGALCLIFSDLPALAACPKAQSQEVSDSMSR